MTGAALETRGLTVRFGGVVAVNDVTLTVPAGKVVGLIGPNGAGKTTFIDAVSGFVASTGGLEFEGASIDHLSPHRRAALGLCRTFQSGELFDDLTVRENVQVATESPRWWSALADCVRPRRGAMSDTVAWALDLLDVGDLVDRYPTDLSLGHRKLVGIARALAARPKVLMLDEPAAGLDTSESRVLGDRVRGLLDHDVTVLLVDHDMRLVLGSCDWLHVIDHGHLLTSGPPSDVAADARVVEAYLGPGAVVG